MIYTIRNSCKELPYDDGAKTIFLYTKGEKGDASQSLKELLEYMKIFEREQMLREEGREEERANTERERQRAEAKLRELLGVTENVSMCSA